MMAPQKLHDYKQELIMCELILSIVLCNKVKGFLNLDSEDF